MKYLNLGHKIFKMKNNSIFLLFSLTIFFLSSAAIATEEYEDEDWKCTVQNINEENTFDGLVKCTFKDDETQKSYFLNYNNGHYESIMFEKPLDDAYISFYQNDGSSWKRNGLSLSFYEDNSYVYSEYKDGNKNGCHLWMGEDDNSFTIYSEGLPNKDYLYESKTITKITKDTVEASVEAYFLNENNEFLNNSFYYTSNTVLDRNKGMRVISAETHYAKMGENGYFGHGVWKSEGEGYFLNYDEKDSKGNPTFIELVDVELDVLIFNSILLETNEKKILCSADMKDFISKLKEKYGVNFGETFNQINFDIENYINTNFNLKLSDNNEIYSSIESFFTAAVSSNEILYLCKDDHDKEMGLSLFTETINASLREGLIDEKQFDRLNNSINLIEKEATKLVNQKGCDYSTNLVYTEYATQMMDAQSFLKEKGIL